MIRSKAPDTKWMLWRDCHQFNLNCAHTFDRMNSQYLKMLSLNVIWGVVVCCGYQCVSYELLLAVINSITVSTRPLSVLSAITSSLHRVEVDAVVCLWW